MKLFGRFFILISLCTALIAGAVFAQGEAVVLAADPDLQPAVSALYAAWHGSAPQFVESGYDLLATRDRAALPADFAGVPPHFLPDAFFVSLSGAPIAAEFVRFATSADGQAALIAAGFLPESVTVVDQVGNTVEIAQPVRRAISPFSLTTYLFYALNSADRLVAGGYLGARSPVGAARMTAIDPRFPELSSYTLNQREINIEQVALLQPDVIFTSARSAWLDTVAELNIPVVLFEGETPERLIESLRIAGAVLGPNAAAHAERWIAYYQSILDTVRVGTRDLDPAARPGVLLVGEDALRVISGAMYQTSIIEAAGGRSVSAELTGYWTDVNLEQVTLWNPDVIVIVPYGTVTVETIMSSPEWANIPAVQTGQVYKMPSWVAPWDTPTADSILGIIWLAGVLHPERLTLDCADEAVYFYATFYGYAIDRDEVAAVCAS
jgi:iron complex transport system substrate-binding protein